MEKKCYHCGEDIGFNSEYYTMQKAIKPPYHHRRFIDIGFVCEDCVEYEHKKTRIDEWSRYAKHRKQVQA